MFVWLWKEMELLVVIWKFVVWSDVLFVMDFGIVDDVLGEGVERKLIDCNLVFFFDGEEF